MCKGADAPMRARLRSRATPSARPRQLENRGRAVALHQLARAGEPLLLLRWSPHRTVDRDQAGRARGWPRQGRARRERYRPLHPDRDHNRYARGPRIGLCVRTCGTKPRRRRAIFDDCDVRKIQASRPGQAVGHVIRRRPPATFSLDCVHDGQNWVPRTGRVARLPRIRLQLTPTPRVHFEGEEAEGRRHYERALAWRLHGGLELEPTASRGCGLSICAHACGTRRANKHASAVRRVEEHFTRVHHSARARRVERRKPRLTQGSTVCQYLRRQGSRL
eukprot:scaffold50558_cov30-Tisochrysis_lutea.AAC.13